MALIWKKAIFDLLFTFLVTREKLQKFLRHISHSQTYTYFAHPMDFFLPYQFWKKIYEFIRYGFSLVWVLVLIFIRAILEQSINNKMVSKIKVGMLLLIFTDTNAKFIVICKPRTLNDGGEDSVKYRNRKKHRFLAAAILPEESLPKICDGYVRPHWSPFSNLLSLNDPLFIFHTLLSPNDPHFQNAVSINDPILKFIDKTKSLTEWPFF